MHNPASPHNTLKLYSSSNMGSSTGATKRLTLADGDRSVNIGDNMREVVDLNEMKLAVRAMCRAVQLIMWWNSSYNAIDGFLHNSNYAFTELNGRSNRAAILSDFINYILGLNAAAWVQKEDFRTSGEIKTIWGEWFGSRPASLLVAADADPPRRPCGAAANSQQMVPGRGRGRGGFRGSRGGYSTASGGHFSQPNLSNPPPTVGGGRGGGSSIICRRWNFNNCPSQSSGYCTLNSGEVLQHRCNAINASGNVCNSAGHTFRQHR